MFTFNTATGSNYEVANGRITRNGGSHFANLTAEPVRLPIGRPEPGKSAYFEVRENGRWVPVTTGIVTEVLDGRYCGGCDTYGDLFRCGSNGYGRLA